MILTPRLTVLVALTAWTLSSSAAAFEVESPVTEGCHESITAEAAERVGWPHTPPAFTSLDRRLVRHLLFDLPPEVQDRWTLALILGVRYNDLKGHRVSDLSALALVHGDPGTQNMHCLRRHRDDFQRGDHEAMRACRAFIRREVAAALDALGPTPDAKDFNKNMSVELSFAFAQTHTVPVAAFAFHLGQALHALQDSYAHTFRSADGKRVHHVLNYVDWADGDLKEERDGHRHLDVLDRCSGTEAALRRRELAVSASRDLLAAALGDPAGSGSASSGSAGSGSASSGSASSGSASSGSASSGPDERQRRVDAVLDIHLKVEGDCNASNGWCNASEREEVQQLGCRVAKNGRFAGAWSLIGWISACLLAWRCMPGRGKWRTPPAGLLCLAALVPSTTLAQSPECAQETPATSEGCLDWACVQQAGSMSAQFTGGASLDEGALAIGLGGQYALHPNVSVGLTGEYNPWVSFETTRVVHGTLNLFATGIYAWPLTDRVRLTSTLHAGASTLLFQTVGIDKGAWGAYVGANLLGVDLLLSRHLSIMIDPADVRAPIPRIHAVPYYYIQYRFTLGMAWRS